MEGLHGLDVVIMHGDAVETRTIDHSLAVRLSEDSARKYGYGPDPAEYENNAGGLFVLRPQVVFAWKEFPKDVTRWRLT